MVMGGNGGSFPVEPSRRSELMLRGWVARWWKKRLPASMRSLLLALAGSPTTSMRTRIKVGWGILRLVWWNQRLGFILLLGVALLFGVLLSPVTSDFSNLQTSDAANYVTLGASLLLVFVFCSFTDSDRKRRFEGYPSRLFTLPVSTGILIAAPVLF